MLSLRTLFELFTCFARKSNFKLGNLTLNRFLDLR